MDGQLTFEFPKPCECGTMPVLIETKCCHWDEKKPQKYLSFYICPNCLNAPVDDTGWTVEAHDERYKAKVKAVFNWNRYPKKNYGIVPFELTEVGKRLRE